MILNKCFRATSFFISSVGLLQYKAYVAADFSKLSPVGKGCRDKATGVVREHLCQLQEKRKIFSLMRTYPFLLQMID